MKKGLLAAAILAASSVSAAACDASCIVKYMADGLNREIAGRDDSALEPGDPKVTHAETAGGHITITVAVHKSAPEYQEPEDIKKLRRGVYCGMVAPTLAVRGLSASLVTRRENGTLVDHFRFTTPACDRLRVWMGKLLSGD